MAHVAGGAECSGQHGEVAAAARAGKEPPPPPRRCRQRRRAPLRRRGPIGKSRGEEVLRERNCNLLTQTTYRCRPLDFDRMVKGATSL
jgi:hypothetical protein